MLLEYYTDFWRIMWHWSNDAENSALITEIYYLLQYITVESNYFKLITFNNISELTVC